jgi:mannose-1-phosphate guanylyltransferase
LKKYNVILSGGVGSRLWPMSRKSKPKQYLPIFNGQTLFQLTAERNKTICDQFIVVGNRENYQLSRRDLQANDIMDFVEIIEACPRNTAAAIAFAAFAVQPQDLLFITPSDHLIQSGEAYSSCVLRAFELAESGYIVTFGLKPTRPETGFGYIESKGEQVLSLREKPDAQMAKSFLNEGNFLWNSGMFCFKAGVFLEELKKFEPKVYESAKKVFIQKQNDFLDEKLSMEIPNISVDYAVMERTDKIKVVPAFFEWSDLGSFESVYDYLLSQNHPVDSAGNMVIGTAIHTEFLGVKETIFVYTDDAILVLKKENAQQVKNIYEKLQGQKAKLT